jgi:hypothetical protein
VTQLAPIWKTPTRAQAVASGRTALAIRLGKLLVGGRHGWFARDGTQERVIRTR